MFCKNCGTENPDGVSFCTSCGTPIEQVVNESVQNPQTVMVNEVAKKKSNKTKIAIISAVLVAVLAIGIVAVIGFLGKDKNSADNMSKKSAKEQMQYSYSNMAKNLSNDVSDVYGKVVNVYGSASAVDGTIELEISDQMLQLLGASLGVETLDTIAIDYSFDMESFSKMGYVLTLRYGTTYITDVELYMDMEAEQMIINLPELTDKALAFDMSEMMDGVDYSYSEMIQMYSVINDILPSEEVLCNLIVDTVDAAFSEIGSVSSGKTSFTAGGVTQTATSYTAVISEETLAKMGIAAIEELKNNDGLKSYLMALPEKVNSTGLADEEVPAGEEFYNEFALGMDEAIAELQTKTDTEEICTLNTWVDSKYNIIAAELFVPDQEATIFYGEAKNGNTVGFELNVADQLVVSGSGSENGNKLTGEFVVEYQETEYATIAFDNFNTTSDYLDGTIKLTLNENLISSMSEELSTVGNVGLRITGEYVDGTQNVVLGLSFLNSEVVTLSMSTTDGGTPQVNIPTDTISDPDEWASTIDIITLLGKLQDSGLYDLIESANSFF